MGYRQHEEPLRHPWLPHPIKGAATSCDIAHQTTLLSPTITPQITRFMGPTWGPPGPCRPQMNPILASWTLLSGSPPGRISPPPLGWSYQCKACEVAPDPGSRQTKMNKYGMDTKESITHTDFRYTCTICGIHLNRKGTLQSYLSIHPEKNRFDELYVVARVRCKEFSAVILVHIPEKKLHKHSMW